jgi:hypothetical protein
MKREDCILFSGAARREAEFGAAASITASRR